MSAETSLRLATEPSPERRAKVLRTAGLGIVLQAVAKRFSVTEMEILGRSRWPSIVRARQCLCWHLVVEWELSTVEAGRLVGRDHTTVIHACRKVKELVLEGTDFAEDYRNLMRTLSS